MKEEFERQGNIKDTGKDKVMMSIYELGYLGAGTKLEFEEFLDLVEKNLEDTDEINKDIILIMSTIIIGTSEKNKYMYSYYDMQLKGIMEDVEMYRVIVRGFRGMIKETDNQDMMKILKYINQAICKLNVRALELCNKAEEEIKSL